MPPKKTSETPVLQRYFEIVPSVNRTAVFLNRDEPIPLLEVYVTTNFTSDKKIYSDKETIDCIADQKTIIVLGSAGCGKSMFMRYLFISLCEKPRGRIPLFIKLRNLTGIKSKDLPTYVYHSVVKPGAVATFDQFEKGMANGLFSLILDGFNEIDFNERTEVEKQIIDLRDKYQKLAIIVSSRDDERFASWESFKIFHVTPLNQAQLVDLISKSRYDADVKNKFIKELKAGLYDKHKSFLSNPLLAVMMLITFKEIAHIPDKLHIFYDQAFDALFFKHDASKEAAFRRKLHSSIPIDDIKRCLSCVCIATYLKEKFSFSESQIKEDLKRAIAMSKVATEPEKKFSRPSGVSMHLAKRWDFNNIYSSVVSRIFCSRIY